MDRRTRNRLYGVMTKTWEVVTLIGAVGCASMGGVFYAFSGFVMKGLTRLPDPQGLEAMKSMNVTAVRPPLMLGLFGTAAVCVALIVRAVTTWGQGPAALLLIGGLVYLVGTIVLTIAYNVPLNDHLAMISSTAPDAASQWRDYARNWTLANHVRAASSVAAGALLITALLQRGEAHTR
jgi:uncharacterized membrane protein